MGVQAAHRDGLQKRQRRIWSYCRKRGSRRPPPLPRHQGKDFRVLRRRFRFRKSSTIKSVLPSVLRPRQTTGPQGLGGPALKPKMTMSVFSSWPRDWKRFSTLCQLSSARPGRGIPRHAEIGKDPVVGSDRFPQRTGAGPVEARIISRGSNISWRGGPPSKTIRAAARPFWTPNPSTVVSGGSERSASGISL